MFGTMFGTMLETMFGTMFEFYIEKTGVNIYLYINNLVIHNALIHFAVQWW